MRKEDIEAKIRAALPDARIELRDLTGTADHWEAVIVSTFGAVVGIVLGTLIGIALSLAVPDTIIEEISFSTSTIIAIIIGAVLAGFIAALYPSVKASRMDILEAIATE